MTMCRTTPKPRRPATPPHSRASSRRSVRPRSAAAIWSRCRLGLPLLLLLASCSRAPELVILSGDRAIVREADGAYRVSEVWLQERYQLERALRVRLEQCEAAQGAAPQP
jgi:hypothetical protein